MHRHCRSPILRAALFAAVIGFVLGVTIPAIAGVANGGYKYYTARNVTYQNQSWIYTDSYSVSACSGAGTYSPPNWDVPAGWIGVKPRCYYTNGVLYEQSAWTYNDVALSYMSEGTLHYYPPHNSYQSWGITSAWTGTVYDAYLTAKSPAETY